MAPAGPLRSFASAERFLAEIASPKRQAGYVFAGDESYLYDRCRRAVLRAFAPDDSMRDFAIHEIDLGETGIFDALDRARTPSLMAPEQALFLRNLKTLYGRGAKKEEFAEIASYFQSPNPGAVVIFVADHLHIPADTRRMDMTDKDRYDRLRETLGDCCGFVELARPTDADAAAWLAEEAAKEGVTMEADAAREMVDALGSGLMQLASELEKLVLYVAERQRITLADVESMVLSAKQRSLYELTDAISSKDRPRALALLQGLLNASDGGEDAAIGQLFMLAKTFRQMLIIVEKNVRDSRAIWQVLWQGFRMPPFAAEDLIRQARRYRSRGELMRAIRLVARADAELRSSPPDKKLVLERLVLDLCAEPKPPSIFSREQEEMGWA